MNTNILKSELPSAATVKSATRVLEIFEYFDEVRRPVTIQDVAQALSYPHSSTAALLKSLVSLGYLEHDDRGRTFFPSIRISLLGNWVEAEALPIRNVQRLMRRLSADTGCTIILAARLGDHAQYIKVIQGTSPIRFHVKPSTRRMLAFSTIGRVLLSELPLARSETFDSGCPCRHAGAAGIDAGDRRRTAKNQKTRLRALQRSRDSGGHHAGDAHSDGSVRTSGRYRNSRPQRVFSQSQTHIHRVVKKRHRRAHFTKRSKP